MEHGAWSKEHGAWSMEQRAWSPDKSGFLPVGRLEVDYTFCIINSQNVSLTEHGA